MRSLTPVLLPANATEALEAVPLQQLTAALGGGASGLITVDAGTVTVDDSGADVEITIETVWGFDGVDGYYDPLGAAPGEEAALMYDPILRTYAIVPYDFPEVTGS